MHPATSLGRILFDTEAEIIYMLMNNMLHLIFRKNRILHATTVYKMEQPNILQIIRNHQGEYSPQQAKVATYFLEYYKKAAFLTATQLAREIGVSQPTVIRFSQFFGFTQYSRFLEAVQDILKAELTSIERLRLSINQSEDDEIEQISIISKEIRTLNRLANTFPQNLLKKLIKQICNSDTVVIVGTRGSASLAQYFSYYLGKVKRKVTSICNGSTQVYDQLMHMGEKDLIVAIAFPRYPRETVDVVRFCKNHGITVAGITDKMDSPLAELADIPLVIPITFSTIHDSFSSVLCIFNMVVTEVGRENRTESEELSVTFEDLARKTKMFVT
jgi:DNA-binding MurR/RpiR family transcriptional regulator